MGLCDFVGELFNKGFMLVPVRGFGRGCSREEAVAVAKCPLVPRGLRYCYDCAVLYSDVSEMAVRRVCAGCSAFGVAGAPSRLFILDLDARVPIDLIWRFLSPDEVFVEVTATGGYHIVTRLERDELDLARKFTGVKGVFDNKTFGYVITYPSRLVIEYDGGREVLHYVKVSRTGIESVEKCLRDVYDRLKMLVRAVEDVCYGTYVERIEGRVELAEAPGPVRRIVTSLPLERALVYAQLCFSAAGCGECTRYYVTCLINNRPIELPSITYPTSIPRGLHTVFEVEFLGALKIVGLSEDQLFSIVQRLRYTVNGEEYICRTPPENNLRYNVLRGTYSFAYKGICPIYLGNALTGRFVPCYCTSTLARKVSALVVNSPDILVNALKVVINA
ncbi:MAG: hypothetical protein GXO26_08085 [Crenarchaeota archaeon]|nr:hypothetical protein [Thermoproteota archaeon]